MRIATVCRVVLVVLALAAPAGVRADTPQGFEGRPLAEVLEQLRAEGLRIIYSSDLVTPEMRVRSEPPEGTLYETLRAVLEPHGLAVEVGPAATLLVVRRRERAPLRLRIEHPGTETVAAGEVPVELSVSGDEPVARVDVYVDGSLEASLERPPYRVVLSLPDRAEPRTFRAVAVGEAGGRAEDSVTTRRVELREEVEVALKQVYLTATNAAGRPAAISRDDLRLFDSGRSRPIVTFERGNLPLTAVVLADASESMQGGRLDAALRGVRAFAAALRPLDESAVLLFADRPVGMAPFHSDLRDLTRRMDRIDPTGGTSLNDALYLGLRALDGRLGRKVIVLLSDGSDVSSVLSMRDVLWKLESTDAQIYWIRLQGEGSGDGGISTSWRDVPASREEARLLRQGIEESGGRIESLSSSGSVEDALHSIVEELRSQVAVGYYPEDRRYDGSWRSLELRVDRPGVRLRYRAGYVDR